MSYLYMLTHAFSQSTVESSAVNGSGGRSCSQVSVPRMNTEMQSPQQ